MSNVLPDPTIAELWLRLTYKCVKLENILFNAASQNATNFITTAYDTTQALEGDRGAEQAQVIDNIRATLSGAISATRDAALAVIKDIAKAIDSPQTEPGLIMKDLFAYMVTNSYEVVERDMTRAGYSADVGNTGNGVMHQLKVDENGFDIETGGPFGASQTWNLRCECKKDSGMTGEEGVSEFDLFTVGKSAYDFCVDSEGIKGKRQVKTIDYRNSLLANAGFTSYNATGNPKFSNWLNTGSDYTGVGVSTTEGYWKTAGSRSATNQAGVYSTLTLDDTASGEMELYQYIDNLALKDDVPYLLCVPVKFSTVAGTIGTFTINLGSKSYVYTPANTNWNLVWLGTTTPKNQWLLNFSESPCSVSFQRTGAPTAAVVYVDSVIFMEYPIYFNGEYLALTRGSYGNEFVYDDFFTATSVSPADQGSSQLYLAKFFNTYLPPAATASPGFLDYA